MDLLDIVDENLRILKTESSDEIHQKGLLHQAIHVLVVNNDGEIFVRRRSKNKKLYPGVLSTSVGAHILSGQTSDECAKDSLRTFLGLNLPLEKIGESFVKDDIENEYISVYRCRSNVIKNLNPKESDEGQFMKIEEIKKLVESKQTTPHLAVAIKFL